VSRDLEKKRKTGREYQRKRRAENPEKARQCDREWYAANPESGRKRSRKYRAEHPEKTRQAIRKYKAANPEKQRGSVLRWRASHPERIREYDRKSALKRKYGLTLEEYDTLVTTQGGRCAICGREDELLSVDHDHADGVIRGLLCRLCNASLGGFHDDPGLLQKAVEYLSAGK
jgi:hypothetical protein